MTNNEEYFGQERVCNLTPLEFEEYCYKILQGYAEEEKLMDFSIVHNVKLAANDGIYQIDIYATYMALGVEMKIICECKQYKNRVNRDKVVLLADKVRTLGAQKGILLSTSGFQSGAIKYAKEHGIALIQVFDTRVNFYSHSAEPESVIDENDPFYFGRKHMPVFRAHLITADTDFHSTVYPTRAMFMKAFKEVDKLGQKMYGISVFDKMENVNELNFKELLQKKFSGDPHEKS